MTTTALHVLREAQYLVCESHKRSDGFLQRINVSLANKQIEYLSAGKEAIVTKKALQILKDGNEVVLLSDAGTPLVSDPGYLLVRSALQEGISVSPIPGVSALTTILSVSPIPCTQLQYVGMLPKPSQGLSRQLEELKPQSTPSVFFVIARDLIDTLDTMVRASFGNREIFLGVEMTKIHERFYFGTVDRIHRQIVAEGGVKGEVTAVMEGSSSSPDSVLIDRCIDAFQSSQLSSSKNLSKREMAKLIGKITRQSVSKIYERLLETGQQEKQGVD